MVFNWFRRQFTQSEDADPATAETSTPPVEVDQQDTEDEVSDTADVDPDPEPSTPVDAPQPEPQIDASAAAETPAKPDYLSWAKAAFANIQQRKPTPPRVDDDVEAPENVEPVEVETQAESSEPEPVAISEPPPVEEPAAPESVEPEADVAAVETPPEPVAPPVASRPTADVDFDEGFIWSAEVLAAQGRRPEEVSVEEITWLKKLRRGLGKTRQGFVNQLKSAVGQGPLSEDGVMEIETLLLQADVGVEATDKLIEALQAKLKQETLPPDAAIDYLKQILRDLLEEPYQKRYGSTFRPQRGALNIWLMTGVNGAGKTTTIGKLAHVATQSGYSCLIAAADTFRAAAVEQVKVWGARSNVEVIANPGQNTDPAAVVYDAIAAANSRDIDLLLVDTAGRLQNKKNLMDELAKVRKIIDKKAANANVESLLVLDATLGQNGLRQAQVFSEAAQITGVVLTKLDGTAKGGIALAVVQQLGLPIRFIGAGEGITDLRPFSSYEFVEALLST